MLDNVRSLRPTPFVAPAFLISLWEKGERRLSFGGFQEVVRPVTEDELADMRTWRAPCPVEDKLLDAVDPIRKAAGWHDRWTESLGGWGGLVQEGWTGLGVEPPPAHVVDLIAKAYPLPATFREALDEFAYWAWRTVMSAMSLACDDTPVDALVDPFGGDEVLDLTVFVRLELVRPLLLHGLRATSIEDVLTRLEIYQQMDRKDSAIEAALARDLAAIQQARSAPLAGGRTPRTAAPGKKDRRRGVQNPRVTELLLQKPRPTDRAIGRLLGVSQSTVGTERRRMIAAGQIDPNEAAEVVRGNAKRPYHMKPRTGRAKAPKPGVSPATEGHAVAASPSLRLRTEPMSSLDMPAPPPAVSSGPGVARRASQGGQSSSAVDSYPLFTWIEKQDD